MAEAKDESRAEQEKSQLLQDMRQLVEEAKSLKAQIDAYLKQAEVSTKKADSEALLAFNAKKACEEHATTISGLKGTVEADANLIATNKQRSDEALAALNTAKAGVDAGVKAIEDRRKEVDQSAAAISQTESTITRNAGSAAALLKQIESSELSVENHAKLATAASTSAEQAAAAADLANKRCKDSSTQAAELVASMTAQRDTSSTLAEQIEALLVAAKTDEANLKGVLEHLNNSHQISTSHEKRVETLSGELESLLKKVEGLLPGATSAGLASSFNKQRSRFSGPQKQWLSTFVICIGLLVIVALPSFLSAIGVLHPVDSSWNAAWRNLMLRLPLVLPIVWLAIYAGRNYMMSLRMEEDYAYKEAISTAFEGYKREMEKITANEGETPTPVTILCTNILRAIAERPGRIYEGRQKDINIATELQEIAEKSAELSKKKLATG